MQNRLSYGSQTSTFQIFTYFSRILLLASYFSKKIASKIGAALTNISDLESSRKQFTLVMLHATTRLHSSITILTLKFPPYIFHLCFQFFVGRWKVVSLNNCFLFHKLPLRNPNFLLRMLFTHGTH